MFNRVKIQSITIIIIRIISKFHNYYYLVILGLVTNEFTETFYLYDNKENYNVLTNDNGDRDLHFCFF